MTSSQRAGKPTNRQETSGEVEVEGEGEVEGEDVKAILSLL